MPDRPITARYVAIDTRSVRSHWNQKTLSSRSILLVNSDSLSAGAAPGRATGIQFDGLGSPQQLSETSPAKSWFLLSVSDSARPGRGKGHTESEIERRNVDRSDRRIPSPENREEIIASFFFPPRFWCYDPSTLFGVAVGRVRGSSLFSSRILSLAERTAVRSSPNWFSLVAQTDKSCLRLSTRTF